MPIYLKIGDIKGNATSSSHIGWIEASSISAPMARKTEDGARTVAERLGTLIIGHLDISRNLDKASVKLVEACASGSLFPEVKLHITTPLGDGEQVLFELILNDVLVASHSFHVVGGASQDISEALSLSYVAIKWVYMNFDPKMGRPMGQVDAQYTWKQE